MLAYQGNRKFTLGDFQEVHYSCVFTSKEMGNSSFLKKLELQHNENSWKLILMDIIIIMIIDYFRLSNVVALLGNLYWFDNLSQLIHFTK